MLKMILFIILALAISVSTVGAAGLPEDIARIKKMALELGSPNPEFPEQMEKIWEVKDLLYGICYNSKIKAVQIAEGPVGDGITAVLTYFEEVDLFFLTLHVDDKVVSTRAEPEERGLEGFRLFIEDLKIAKIINEVLT